MSDARTCPHCGERVYATDQVCLSCGKPLAAAAPAAAPVAGPQPTAGPPRPRPARPELRVPWTARLTDACGDWWGRYPLIVLGLFLLVGLLRALHAPALVVGPLALMWLLVYLGLYVWVIVDIISMEAERYWLWLIFLFGPPALVAYFIWGR